MVRAPSVLDAEGKKLRAASSELKGLLEKNAVIVKNAAHLHGLCGGLRSGDITIEGDTGDYLAVVNNGAVVKATGNAGKYLADNMTDGSVVVEGNADYGAAQYCYGGTVVIRGNAGDFTATMNKGATVVVGGDVGTDAATYMVAGDVIILGDAGENLGNYLIRGNIYIKGDWASLGHNCCLEEMGGEDSQKLGSLLDANGVKADVKAFRKITPLSGRPFYTGQEAAQ